MKKNKKIALVVAYRGSEYKGWQAQKTGVATVQHCLEKAISNVANHPVNVICAGRTDAKVHASAQVIHFETHVDRDDRAWVFGVNSHLPSDIAVVAASRVADDFHARFSAVSRRYRYVIYTSEVKPALLAQEVTWTYKSLDVEKMRVAAQCFLGTHDFSSFRAVGCQAKSPVRTILNFDIYPSGQYIVIDVRANAFLHHMIRNFAGVLMAIGAGEKTVDWAYEVLDARDRTKAGVTAPPFGLYFVHAEYPTEFHIPQVCLGPHFLPQVNESNYDMR
ncbi:tRNA pseudouridine(38-40) synthase TruA [Marinomonas agarivorans]|nr:tRNA pseudouridine(38-40) synthase TruA [Marinomonas agarivorans]